MRRVVRAACAAVLALAAALPCAAATTFTVTSTANDGADTLRDALANVADGGTIEFSIFPLPATIALESELLVDKNVTITGPGPDQLTLNGQQLSRVFYIAPDKAVMISGLTVANGMTSATGGGVHNLGTLTLEDCTLSENSAAMGGGGVYTEGSLTIKGCTLSDNRVDQSYGGGAIAAVARTDGNQEVRNYVTIENSLLQGNEAPSGGGIFIDVEGGMVEYGAEAHAVVTVIDSTLSDNSATGDGYVSNGGALAIVVGGDWLASARVTVENCTFSGNSATGGSEFNTGGAITVLSDSVYYPGVLILRNSTLSNNTASATDDEGSIGAGGAIWLYGEPLTVDEVLYYSTLTALDNCTLSGNQDSSGVSGILNWGGKVELKNTILANHPSGANIADDGFFGGTVISHGYNLSTDDGAGFLTKSGDQVSTDAGLGPLADNGGPTQTHALLWDSPAIDAAARTDILGNDVNSDQRGVTRPQPLDGANDIGAFELGCLAYSWSGVLKPFKANGGSVFKAGKTVPVKFRLTGCSAAVVDLQAALFYAVIDGNEIGELIPAVSTSSAITDNLFRYDRKSGQYVFNWSTKGLSPGAYRLVIDLGDGVERTVELELR